MRTKDPTKRKRYVKNVIINSVNALNDSERIVNEEIDNIYNNGGTVVSIVPHNFGINPLNLIFIIIYECDHVIKEHVHSDQKKKT